MKIKKIVWMMAGALTILASCKKFTDINQNPNTATNVDASLVLPQSIVYTAANSISFHDYGSWQVGYFANAGGYGGWGSTITYEYTTGSFNGLWSTTYDNLQDFEFIILNTNGRDSFSYFNAAARIMKVLNFQWIVDEYNAAPYSEALKGVDKLTPKYDDGQEIYRQLYAELDAAIATINGAKMPNGLGTASDPLFGGNMTRWKQLANTLKLKLRVRASATNTFTGTPTFSADGFLAEDAVINPTYSKTAGQQNPFWNTYHSSATGSQSGSGRSRIPTYWIVTFYDGSKLDDEGRGNTLFRGFKNGLYPPRNQLGNTASNAPQAPSDNTSWYTEDVNYANSGPSVGVLKGPAQGHPLLLAAESYLLQAEAVEKGLLTGNAKTLFNKGIEMSFTYLFKGQDNKVLASLNPVTATATYLTNNSGSRLANYDLATTPAQKLEAIITQKYIALNMIDGREAWAEFRRTGYPTINNALPLNQSNTFVSTVSASTATDRLPGRVLYPNNEFQINPANVPQGINTFTSYVFWDRRK